MITVNSVSGGKTSAYLMAKFPADYNIFQLVRTEDEKCLWMEGKDEKTRQIISDRIGMEFWGTMEEDEIIYTILDLEQYLGKEIIINTSYKTFEKMIEEHGARCLPSVMRRYCTEELKLQVAFDWWYENINQIVEMRIGYRCDPKEIARAKRMDAKCNNDGLLPFKHIIGTKETKKGLQNVWEETFWQKPIYPLIEIEPTYNDQISKFWKDKPVRFAEFNNCVGCFHRDKILLKYMWEKHPNKMQVFADFEKNRKYKNDTFKMDDKITYERIKNWDFTGKLEFSDFTECDNGFCEP